MRRLQGLQCRIDLERMRARTPLKSCLRLSALMWDAFLECRDALNGLVVERDESASVTSQPAGSAKIVNFPKENKYHTNEAGGRSEH